MVAHLAGARVDHEHIFDAHRQIPGRVDAEILLLVAKADNLDHRLGHLLPRLVDVRRLDAEDGDVGAPERAVRKNQAGIGQVMAAAAGPCDRLDAGANAIDQLLVPDAGQQPPCASAAGNLELDLSGRKAGQLVELSGDIVGSRHGKLRGALADGN